MYTKYTNEFVNIDSIMIAKDSTPFIEWLLSELKDRGLNQAQFAYKCGMTRGALNGIINGRRNPGYKLLSMIAFGLGYTDDIVFARAGIERRSIEETETAESMELESLYNQLKDDGHKRQLMILAKMLLNIEAERRAGRDERNNLRGKEVESRS